MIRINGKVIDLGPYKIPSFILEPLNLCEEPPHPGKTIALILEASAIAHKDFAKRIGVRPKTINHLCKGHVDVSAELALRLGKAFNTDYSFWLDRQREHDVHAARMNMQSQLLEIQTYF